MRQATSYIGASMLFRFTITVAACALGGWASPALADPCEGALPAKGTGFSGIVRYVGDGDGLCVGPASRPDLWIEIRLADFYAPELHEPGGQEARRRLESMVKGKRLLCRAGRHSYDRIVAACTLVVSRWAAFCAALAALRAVEVGDEHDA